MALLPIAFRVQIDEDGKVGFQLEEGKRLNAWHLWLVAEVFGHMADDLHANDRAAAQAKAQVRQSLAPIGALNLRDLGRTS